MEGDGSPTTERAGRVAAGGLPIISVTKIKGYPCRLTRMGTGKDACVSVPITGQEPLRRVVTVVTEVIVPQTGRTSAAGVAELRRWGDSSVIEDIATTV